MEYYIKRFAAIICLVAVLTSNGAVLGAVTFAPLTADVAENSETVSITLTGEGETSPYTFTMDSQNPDLGWFAISTDGVISLAAGKTIDYEETTLSSFVYNVLVHIADSTTTSAVTAIVTLAVTVTDVNESPVFGSDIYAAKSTTALAAGNTITTVAATDPEGDAVTYSISDSTNFGISTTGEVTVNTGITIATSTTLLTEVYAADADTTAKLTATVYIFICVGTTCSMSAAATITGSILTAIGVLMALLMKFT